MQSPAIALFGLQARGQPGLWNGDGPDYRVKFEAQGVRFTPALGIAAEREGSLEFVASMPTG